MNRLKRQFFGFGIAATLLVFTTTASAQATRTWVSGVGDDANPCSRTAPCKTFAGAISKTNANGEIDCLDPGGFGGVTITKSITLDCGNNAGGILVSGTPGITISANASDVVTLRNLVIIGQGSGTTGINFVSGGGLHAVNLTITGFTSAGIAVSASGSQVSVDNATISECADGIRLNPTGSVISEFEHVRLWNNTNGLNAQGVATNASIRDSSIAMNTVGVLQSGASGSGTMLVSQSQFTANGTAVQAATASNISIFSNLFGQNGTVLNPHGGAIFTDGQNLPAPGNGLLGTANGGTISKM
jgi:hypothetical protein